MAFGKPHGSPASPGSSGSDSSYDSEEERRAARVAAAGLGTAADAHRRAQAELLHAYRARQAARDALERDALRAKLQRQCGDAGAGQAWDAGDGSGGWAAGTGASPQQRGRAWVHALQQHERLWTALEAARKAASSSSSAGSSNGSTSCVHGSAWSLAYADVPWPPLEGADYLRALAAWEQHQHQRQGQAGQQAQGQGQAQGQLGLQAAARRAYARACLRWHPDKFEGRWGAALAPADRGAVLERVQALSQGINQAWEALQRELAAEAAGEG